MTPRMRFSTGMSAHAKMDRQVVELLSATRFVAHQVLLFVRSYYQRPCPSPPYHSPSAYFFLFFTFFLHPRCLTALHVSSLSTTPSSSSFCPQKLDTVEADTVWADFTCTLGFPIMGIWPNGSDGTDVNAVHVGPTSYHPSQPSYVVTADDSGRIKLFNAPCVVEDAPCRSYGGHSSHVSSVRWVGGAQGPPCVVSTGGNDGGVLLWELEEISKKDKP